MGMSEEVQGSSQGLASDAGTPRSQLGAVAAGSTRPTFRERLALWADAFKAIKWKRVLILGGIGIVVAAIAVVLIVNFVPVGWSRFIGDFAQNDAGRAILVGLIVGFCFTLVPLMVLLLLAYRSPAWVKVVLVVVAVLLATPNLLTLWIQTGASGSVHAADRIMDTEAYGFSGASIWGAVIGVLAFLVWAWLFISSRLTKKKLKTLRETPAGS
ncbi:hypothetical protein MIAR_33110 [Microbacterium arabinogalactanolyticum]|nr:hypothetical protein MIAR_33110 [Microbacterium arabinogalactanolyticum]